MSGYVSIRFIQCGVTAQQCRYQLVTTFPPLEQLRHVRESCNCTRLTLIELVVSALRHHNNFTTTVQQLHSLLQLMCYTAPVQQVRTALTVLVVALLVVAVLVVA